MDVRINCAQATMRYLPYFGVFIKKSELIVGMASGDKWVTYFYFHKVLNVPFIRL
jgi:hypothetical protein